jgi:hypothetical protein
VWDVDGDGVLEIPITRGMITIDAAETTYFDLKDGKVSALGSVVSAG